MTLSEFFKEWRMCRGGKLEADIRGMLAAKDAEIAKLKTEIAALTKRTATYEAGIRAVVVLIDESHGVDGLHKNGDIATWSELRAGGNFESWLSAFDAAVEVLGNG